MNCNSELHNEFKNTNEVMCPFCNQQIAKVDKVVELCCDKMDLNDQNTCINCGVVNGDIFVIDYVNFYDDMYKIKNKSVYHRKYHIEKVLDCIFSENNIQLTYHQIKKIFKVFVEIDSVLHKVNYGRKRMISIKYVIKQLFKILGLPYKDINVTKSKRTLTYYEQYWKKVKLLIGDRIQSIINA